MTLATSVGVLDRSSSWVIFIHLLPLCKYTGYSANEYIRSLKSQKTYLVPSLQGMQADLWSRAQDQNDAMYVFAGVCKLSIERGYIANTTTILEVFPAVPCSECCSEFLYSRNLSVVCYAKGEGGGCIRTACCAVGVWTSCFSKGHGIKGTASVSCTYAV